MACSTVDTGIWGINEMKDLLTKTSVRGVFMWNINDYFMSSFYTTGHNPINSQCSWTNNIGLIAGLEEIEVAQDCYTYSG